MFNNINDNNNDFLYNSDTKTIIQMKSEEPCVIISEIIQDTSMCIADEKVIGEKQKDTDTERADGTVTGRYALFEGGVINLYEENKKEPLLSIPCMTGDAPLFAFFREDEQLIVYHADGRAEIWDLGSGANLVTKQLDIDNYYKTNILADPDGEYFAVYTCEGIMSVSPLYGKLNRELNLYYVDRENQIHSYADVSEGYVDFEKKKVYTYDRGKHAYYGAPLYDYKTLKQKATELLNADVDTFSGEADRIFWE